MENKNRVMIESLKKLTGFFEANPDLEPAHAGNFILVYCDTEAELLDYIRRFQGVIFADEHFSGCDVRFEPFGRVQFYASTGRLSAPLPQLIEQEGSRDAEAVAR